MRAISVCPSLLLLIPCCLLAAANPFVGRWDFNVPTPKGVGANWLGITEHDGKLAVWFQPTGGNVYEIKDYTLDGSRLTFHVKTDDTWELNAKYGKLTGTESRAGQTIQVTGEPAPALARKAPKHWGPAEPLFNGKDLSGWQPIGSPDNSHWVVKDGELVNTAHGDNLKTEKTFTDFKLHFEVNCPDNANSGFYLRGRYEVQIESEPLSENPPERRIGSIYGRLTPAVDVARTPGQWETFDVTLVGRTVTVVHNGKTVIDHKQIEGITGGALDANEGEPGPFYIQGDHTGGLRFRNITVALPQ